MVDVIRQKDDRSWVTVVAIQTSETHASPSRSYSVPISELEEPLQATASERGISDSLVRRVLREARGSSFWTNESDAWTPIGSAFDYADEGRWSANRSLEDRSLADAGEPAPEADLSLEIDPEIGPLLTMWVRGSLVGSLTVAAEAIVIPIDSGDRSLRLRLAQDEMAEGDETLRRLRARGPAAALGAEVVLWKVYTGTNSWSREAATTLRQGVTTIRLRGLEGAGFAVGRTVRVVSRRLSKQRNDPLAVRRLRRQEGGAAALVKRVPRLADGSAGVKNALVIVHGTMSHGVGMASELERILDAKRPAMVRFEHDTWHSLENNAQELAGLIASTIEGRVLLVAHSRGGLVAARAARILDGREHGTPRVVTLGTPFCGTPLAHAPRLANGSISALAAGVRTLTGPAIDPLTRVASLLLRADPIGLRIMQPDHDALPMLRDSLPSDAELVGGECSDPSRHYEGRQGLLRGVGRGTFADEPNDLVVALSSAHADRSSGHQVDSDHFSYMVQPNVEELLRSAARWLGESDRLVW